MRGKKTEEERNIKFKTKEREDNFQNINQIKYLRVTFTYRGREEVNEIDRKKF